MIQKLKHNLYSLFISSTLLIFSVVLSLLIYENIESNRKRELAYFNKMITTLVLHLEHQADYTACLKLYEEKLGMSFQLLSEAGSLLYQSGSLDDHLIESFLASQQSLANDFTFNPSSLKDDSYYSRQSGAYTIKSINGKKYYCVSCLIVTGYDIIYTLITTKEYPDFAALLKPVIGHYAGIWVCVFVSLLFLSKALVQKAVKPTETAIQSQKDFIAAVSHECKAPLATILSSAEMINALPDVPIAAKKHIRTIDSEVIRMSRLIQDLLLLSSLDAGNWSFHRAEIDIDTLMINLYTKFEPICKEKNILLRLELPEEACPSLFSDEDRLTQIISIFLDNAITYSPSESEILLQSAIKKGEFAVSITDHGTGIHDKDKPFIFNRFYQCDKSHTQREHFGLGLSIANELVFKLGGRIELFDTEGGGCTFKVFLPLAFRIPEKEAPISG